MRPEGWFHRVVDPPRGVRRLAAEDLHVTVAFLGRCGEERARAAFALAPRFVLEDRVIGLGPVVAMGKSAIATLVVEGAPGIRRGTLACRDAMTDAAGAPPERRPPRPHLTLARLERQAGAAERQAAMRWAAGLDISGARPDIDRLALYASHPDPGEVRYRILDSLGL